MARGVRTEQVHREIKRQEDERLRLAPEVMGGNPGAVAKDRRLEGRIRELAGSGKGHHPAGATEPELRGVRSTLVNTAALHRLILERIGRKGVRS